MFSSHLLFKNYIRPHCLLSYIKKIDLCLIVHLPSRFHESLRVTVRSHLEARIGIFIGAISTDF